MAIPLAILQQLRDPLIQLAVINAIMNDPAFSQAFRQAVINQIAQGKLRSMSPTVAGESHGLHRLINNAINQIQQQIQQAAQRQMAGAAGFGQNAPAPQHGTQAAPGRPTLAPTALNALPGGQTTANRLQAMANNRGYSPQTLYSMTEMSGGLYDIQYRFQDATGVVHRFNATIDRFGGIMERIPRRLQPFGQAIMKDALEFVKWSAGISLVLIPLQKLSQLTTEAIENQTKLVNVLIALGEAQKGVNEVFDAAASIAQQTGEAVGGVIDAYALAYRATGGTATETERFSIAGKLLSDSLILSKLSALDQAEAIDILSAALKQSAGEFAKLGGSTNALENGQILLDKWVRTTKVANVSLETLATSFSIVSDAASSAGLDVDQLNGVIAVLSEVTGDVSGKEIGNMARALVSGFQSDKAARQLQSLGIAITNVSGDAKGFMDIYGEIASLRGAGLLSDDQMNKITLAIGGGTRRQAIVQAFIEQFGRIQQVSESSSQASGDALDALDKQLATVSTSSTRLANSFTSLAQTLGTKGGLLDIFTATLNAATGLTTMMDRLVGSVGRVAPFLGLALAGSAFNNTYLASRPGALGVFRQNTANRIGGSIQGTLANSPIFSAYANWYNGRQQRPTMAISPASIGQSVGGALTSELGMKRILGWGGVGLSALSNLTDSSATGEEKAKRIGADISGAIIGNLLTAGNPVGMIIGSAAAEALVNNTVLYKADFQRLFEDIFPKEPNKANAGKTEAELRIEEQKKFTDELLSRGEKGIKGDYYKADIIFRTFTSNLSQWLRGSEAKITPEQMALYYSTEEQKNKFYGFSRENEASKGVEGSKFQERMAQVSLPSSLIAQFKTQIMQELLAGKITPSTFTNYSETLGNISTLGQKYYAGFGEQYGQKTGQTQMQTLEDIVRTATYANAEELNYLTSLNDSIATLYNTMQLSSPGTEKYNTALEEYNTLTDEAATYLERLNQVVLSRKALPEVSDYSEYTSGFNLSDLVAQARTNQQNEYMATGFTPEEYQAKINEFEKFYVKTSAGYSQPIDKLDPRYLAEVIAKAAKEGIIEGEQQSTSFQQFDMTSQEFMSAMKNYQATLNAFTSAGYDPDFTETVPVFTDGIAKAMKADWKIVQYLLGNIDKNTKDITGIYNLPSGSSFYIPSQAADLWKKTATSGLDTGVISMLANLLGGIPGFEPGSTVNNPTTNGLLTKRPDITPNEFYDFKEKQADEYGDRSYGLVPGKNFREGGLLDRFSFMGLKQMLGAGIYGDIPTVDSSDAASFGIGRGLGVMKEFYNPVVQKTEVPDMKASLNLNLMTTTILQVDGKQMAMVVKKYLSQDMATFTSGNTNITGAI